MKRALLVALAACGCSLREPRVTAASCTSNRQCAQSNLCFLGECRAPASGLTVVTADVRPPGGSPYGARQIAVDLRQSVLNDFALSFAVAASGTVTQSQSGPVAGAIVTFSDHAAPIPDRVEQIVAVSDGSGAFSARVPRGTFDVVVQPPAPLPPQAQGSLDTTSATVSFDFVLAAPSVLQPLQGALAANDASVPLPGASVTALDGLGAPVSAPALSQADGKFALSLAPGTVPVALQIGPANGGADAGVGASDPLPTYDPVAAASLLVLPLPEAVTVAGTVMDASSTPIPSAVVYARSTTPGWTLARSVATRADGTYSVTLRAGTYLMQAAPPADPASPALSAQQAVAVPAAGPLNFTCPRKVHRIGQVLGPDGKGVGANVQIIASRPSDRLEIARSVTQTTDSTGFFSLTVDSGRWRLEIVPPADLDLPRKIVQVDLDPNLADAVLPDIQISPPLHAVGTVFAEGSPLSGTTLSFYSLDSAGHGVFLGSALTDARGQYKAVLPDVASPGTSP